MLICGRKHQAPTQLLIICNASTKAYAAAVYLRVKEGSNYQTNILFITLHLVPTQKGKKEQTETFNCVPS